MRSRRSSSTKMFGNFSKASLRTVPSRPSTASVERYLAAIAPR